MAGKLILTTIDEGILGQESTLLFLMIRVKAKDKDVVHRYEKARKQVHTSSTITTVQRHVQQIRVRLLCLRVDINIVMDTPRTKTVFPLVTHTMTKHRDI